MLRRTLSLLLALVMVLGLVPTAALATEETSPETVAETVELIPQTTEAAAQTTEAPVETTEAQETLAVPETTVAEETAAAAEPTEYEEETVAATEETILSLEAQMEAAMALARAATSGSCGDALTWAIADGVLTISGTGDMDDYATDNHTPSLEDSPWRLAEAPFTSVVIRDGVASIGDGAFMGLEDVTSVTLPVSVQSVGAYAFSGCTGLEDVIFPEDANGLKGIGACAFADCYNLTVSLPSSVLYVSEDAFSFCMGTVVVEYTGTLEQWMEVCEGDLGDNVIVNCSDTVIDPSKLPITGKCGEDLTWSLDRETGVLTVSGTGAMDDYNDSDNLSPWHNAGVTVTKLVVEEGVASIGSYAFVGMKLQTVTLPGSVKAVGEGAFASCTGLTKVTMNEGTETVGEKAFADCEVLAKVVVPGSVESVADTAFADCPSYLTVEYPGTEEEWNAVYGGPAVDLEAGVQLPVTSGTCGEDLKWSVSEDGVLTVTGTGAMADYNDTDNLSPWRNTGVAVTVIRVEEGVTSVGDCAFTGLAALAEVTLPASVTEVGAKAFKDCEALTAVTFTGDAPAIAEDAFTGVTADVRYPHENGTYDAYIANNAGFGGDLTWKTPEIVDQGTAGGMSWTLDENNKLMIQGTGDTIPAEAFAGRTDIVTVVLPESVTSIGDGAFEGCVNLENINLDNVTELGKDCFKDTRAGLFVDISGNDVFVNTQTAQLTYAAPAAIKAENIRWEILSSTAESHADITAEGILHVTSRLDVEVRCYDSVSGAWDKLKIHSEYVPVIVEPVLEAGSPAVARMLTENAEPAANEKQLSKYALYLDKEDVAAGTYTFDIRVSCADPGLDLSNIKFTSTNTKVATVKGSTVTVKKKADGAAVILAQVMKDKKTVLAEGMLSVYVREYTPRLDETKLTLNTLTADREVTTGLVESYGNAIRNVKLEGTDALAASWENGKLTVRANGLLAKGTNAKLTVTCYNQDMDLEKDYPFDLKINVKNTAPAITAKQADKFDLFYFGSTAQLTVTAKDAKVLDVALAGCDFAVDSFDAETGIATVAYADTYTGGKAVTKGTLLVTLDGYAEPVEKAVTIGTVTSKPQLVLTAASSVINTALAKEPVTGFAVYDLADYQNLVKYVTSVTCTKDFATYGTQGTDTAGDFDDVIILTLNGTAGGTATVEVKRPEWTQSVKLTHKVTVNTKAPKVTMAASTIALYTNFPGRANGTQVYLDQANLILGNISGFTATGKNAAEAEKLLLTYDPGENVIYAAFRDAENLPANGTYTFTAVPALSDGTELAPMTFKVSVADAAPAVKLSASSIKLNKALNNDTVELTAAVSKNNSELLLAGFAYDKVDGLDLVYDRNTQALTVKVDSTAVAGKYTLNLQPVFEAYTGEQAEAGKAVKLTVQVYDTSKINVSISNKGKLDAIVPESAITYTVNKISNAMGALDGVALYGQDADKFDVVLGQENGKQTFRLTMKPGMVYNTKTTYKVGFLLSIGGIQVEGPVKTFKVTQSKLKFSILPKTLRYYQSQKGTLDVTVTLTAPDGAKLSKDGIRINADKTNASFIRALGNGNTTVNTGEMKVKKIYEKNGQICVDLSFDIRNSGHLTAGKSFPVVLDILPNGNAENVAATQLKLTVKAFK